MTLSVIMPFRGPDHFEERWSSYMWLRDRYDALLPQAEIIIGDDDSEPFNRARARNNAVAEAKGDLLCFADADTVFNAGQILRGCQLVVAGAPWAICYDLGLYYNLTEQASKAVKALPAGAHVYEPTDPAEWDHKIDSWAGLLLVPRAAYDKVGGYDEHFTGWGYEDNAFRFALDRRVGPHVRAEGRYALHLWHPSPESECFGQPEIAANRERCRQYEAGEL